MAFELDKVIPWGRSLAEYTAMFALNEEDLKKRILGCGDGPASFNAELTAKGGSVVSIDPLYQYNAEQISTRFKETYDEVMVKTAENADEFVWKHIGSVEELGKIRTRAMQDFIADYPDGKAEGRYINGSTEALPFEDDAFDLGLSSHFLFLYSQLLDLDFHIESLTEMCRVCQEIRTFPLLQLGTTPSPLVEPVQEYFEKKGRYSVSIQKVPFEFQKGGNEMLVIKRH